MKQQSVRDYTYIHGDFKNADDVEDRLHKSFPGWSVFARWTANMEYGVPVTVAKLNPVWTLPRDGARYYVARVGDQTWLLEMQEERNV